MPWESIREPLFLLASLLAFCTAACAVSSTGSSDDRRSAEEDFERRRQSMVSTQIEARGIRQPSVLEALRRVPRHLFVPPELRGEAYAARPLPIGLRQTISQPYIVALMTELIQPDPGMKVLEVGTGSGYQAAVLARCAGELFTIEIVPELGRNAAELLDTLGHTNVHARIGDGFDGWPEQAPFGGIVVTAAPARIPQPLLDQLAPGGRLVIPVGEGSQQLVVVTRTADGFERRSVTPVRFVPMTGKALDHR